ncbi:organic cation transporter protein isoform X1 [Manduca sexta]|uniref:organic cation transporter protein isoform X1 n=1 Tax=Manduca sexta TaxID=7130 RepID=UPI00188F412E|nr:organic cation transporter protein isoform X1 [Manduca sexta]
MGYKNNKKIYDVSEVLEVFGKYQIIQYSLICVSTVFICMIDINYIFVAGNLKYRCRIPECEDVNSTAEFPTWWPITTRDACTRPVLKEGIFDACSNNSFIDKVEECTEWIYESNDTVVAELNLACQPWKINLIGTIHSIGMLISMAVCGWMCDRFGRKPTLVVGLVGSCMGQFKTLATTWPVYVTVEFLEASMSGGTYTTAMVLMLEICGQSKRILSGVLFSYFIYSGELLFASIAMFVPYWKNIVRIIYTPCIFFFCYIFLIHESPRWQIVKGKTEEAKKNMLLIAKTNKVNLNTEEFKNIDGASLKDKFNIKEHEVKESIVNVITSKEIWKRLLVAAVCRYTASFVYYGLMVNSVFLPGDKYVNFLLSTVMSFPGELICLYLMNKIGRKLPLMVGFIMSGVFCIASGYVSDSYTWGKIILFLFGKMIISACFTGAITYTMELFPTSARGSLLAMSSFTSRVGGMLAPLTPMLNSYSEAVPSICFGASALLSGVLLTLTPETKDLPLMDTVQQVEDSVKKKKELI